ncbi:MAG: caspase family protein [Elusimicrobia bacterium]|nr:caspase family protein [Elusimicrobiota bacterium]
MLKKEQAFVFCIGVFLFGGCAFKAAVRGDVDALRKQSIQDLDECKLCMAGVRTSALGCAAANGHADAVRALLEMGAKPNNCHGNPSGVGAFSPLGMALMNHQHEIVEILLDAGADPSYNDGMGNPLGYAGNDELEVSMLLKKGADVSGVGGLSGLTPLQEAEKLGYSDVLPLLRKAQRSQEAALAPAVAPAAAAEAVPAPAVASPWSDVDEPKYRLASRPSDFGVIVGVEKYSNGLPEAQFAERDAKAVRAHLVAMGVPERNIKLLTGERATKGQLEAYLKDWLPRLARTDGRVFFYFSGHGAPDPSTGEAYLVPFDGDPSYLARTALPVKELYASLNALKARRVIVALDSCFSGAGGRSVLPQGARPLVTHVDRGVPENGNIVLFAAASGSEITSTLQEQSHGAFTYYFLKGLGGDAKDASGAVTGQALYRFLKPKVQDAAARQNRDQTPVLEGPASDELTRF